MVKTGSVLVTGATGLIGGLLIERLQRRAGIVAAVTHPVKAAPFESRGIATRILDFTDPGSLCRAMSGVACVFLLLPFDERMSAWASDAAEAARVAGVRRLVRLSGFGADAGSDCLLNRIQGEIDDVVRDSGLPYTLLRPNAFMQNFSRYHGDAIRRQDALYLPDGDGRTSYVDARDIAAVAAEVLVELEPYETATLDITGPRALSGAEVAGILSSVAGRPVAYHPVGKSAARQGMAGMPPWDVEALLSLGDFVRAGGAAPVRNTIRDITGREPIDFHQFARDHAQVWRCSER